VHLNYIEGWSCIWQRWNNNLSGVDQKHGKRGINQWLYSVLLKKEINLLKYTNIMFLKG